MGRHRFAEYIEGKRVVARESMIIGLLVLMVI